MRNSAPGARRLAAALVTALAPATRLAAQQPTPPMPMDRRPSMAREMSGPLGIPMSRDGSGTAWQPDSTPSHALHRMAGAWTIMLHGKGFLQYVADGGSRGRSQLGVTDWIMGMARRTAAGGFLSVRAMMSTDPLSVGRCGYPDLLATGETCRGQPLHDQQHPHDMFMELAAAYERPLSSGVALELYAAPAGEPALGPVAFPHRASAMSDPVAPIGHHWLDATHISFGVMTAGIYGRRWKLEGSVFNGREPDEYRYNLDLGPLDSYSARLWFMPNPFWALQVSAGRLNHVERLAPAEAITRTTASGSYHRPMGRGRLWATSIMWGRNDLPDHATQAVLVESDLGLTERQRLFGRVETTQKTGDDLALGVPALASRIFGLTKLSAGYEHDLASVGAFAVGVGLRGSVNVVPGSLAAYYGSRTPVGLTVFLSVSPVATATEPMTMDGDRPMRMP